MIKKPIIGTWEWIREDKVCKFTITINEDINIKGNVIEDKEKFCVKEILINGRIIQFKTLLPSTKHKAVNLFYVNNKNKIYLNSLPQKYWDNVDKQNDGEPELNIGDFYYHFAGGLKENYQIAFDWYYRSAKKGNIDAFFNLGWMYYEGHAVKKNSKKAVFWYKKAASSGHSTAQNNLSVCYLLGKGIKKDLRKSFYWVKKSAYNGDKTALASLGWHYLNGIGIDRNAKKAKYWYKKASTYNDICSFFSLGQIEYDEKKYEDAKYWFEKAIESNHPRSFYYLGRMYFEGKGVTHDLKKSEMYLRKAMELNRGEAKRLLESKLFKKALQKTTR